MKAALASNPSMEPTRYVVTKRHTSEYSEPITVKKGDPLAVGERYAGQEQWHDWFLCSTPGQQDGWVPAQIIETLADGCTVASEDYTARELNVEEGDTVLCTRMLNGWGWCESLRHAGSGWVPLENLKTHRHGAGD